MLSREPVRPLLLISSKDLPPEKCERDHTTAWILPVLRILYLHMVCNCVLFASCGCAPTFMTGAHSARAVGYLMRLGGGQTLQWRNTRPTMIRLSRTPATQ